MNKNGVVGLFRASSRDNGDDQVQQEHLVRKIFEYQFYAGNFGEFCPSTGVFPLGQTRK